MTSGGRSRVKPGMTRVKLRMTRVKPGMTRVELGMTGGGGATGGLPLESADGDDEPRQPHEKQQCRENNEKYRLPAHPTIP